MSNNKSEKSLDCRMAFNHTATPEGTRRMYI